jgi:hypothetical protein
MASVTSMPYHMMSMPKTVNAILLGGDGIGVPHFHCIKIKYFPIFGRDPPPLFPPIPL